MYLQVLLPSQAHASRLIFRDPHVKEAAVVGHDGLDARLVVHVLHELFAGGVSNPSRPCLLSRLASEEILHIDAMYPMNEMY